MKYYILVDRKPVQVDLMAWAKWFEDFDKRQVFRTEFPDAWVSTIFIGMDCGVLHREFFETAFCINGSLEVCARYDTWEEADAGHKFACSVIEEIQAEAKELSGDLIRKAMRERT